MQRPSSATLNFILLPGLLLASSIQAVTLRESQLRDFIKDGVPAIDQLTLQTERAELDKNSYQDRFSTVLYSETISLETDDFRYSPQDQSQVFGYRKKHHLGISSYGALQLSKQKLPPYPTLQQPLAGERYFLPSLTVGVEVDLWRNLLGAFDEAEANQIRQKLTRSETQKKLETHSFFISLRSLYWRLAAQNRRIEIYRQLAATAKRGYEDIKARLRDNIADKGQVAKLSANLSSAEAQLKTATIQRTFLLRELRKLLPQLLHQQIDVAAGYTEIRKSVYSSVQCVNQLGRYKGIPYEYTEFDDLIRQIDEEFLATAKVIDYYDHSDVTLSARTTSFGFDKELAEAQSQVPAYENKDYEVKLSIQIPLGSLDQTEQQNLRIARREAQIHKTKIESDFKSIHDNLQRVINHLNQAVQLYHQSIGQLETSFANSKVKFKQGRIGVHEYLDDQNALLTAQLQVLTIEEQIVLETLGYFRFFNQAPCSFNRI